MAETSKHRLQLLDLPNEVITSIFTVLDTPSPFADSIIEHPKPTEGIDQPPLKQCSLLCHRLRQLSLPLLFHRTCLNPQYLRSFMTFVKANNLSAHVISITAYLPAPCSHYHPPWWATALSSLPALDTISILAPPHNFFEITGESTPSTESWAFNIKHQILSFSYDPSLASPVVHSTTEAAFSLLTARPWTSFTINEGSSLKCYTTYEYFLRRTPSPIYSISPTTRTLPPLPNPFLTNLRSFSFIAIFPIYNHVDSVLSRVKQMSNLKRLFIKLIPQPDSTILGDEISATLAHFDIHDPWREFDTSLALIASACVALSDQAKDDNDVDAMIMGSLRELRIDDVKMLGVKDNIEEIVNRYLTAYFGWSYEGDGIWRRQTNTTNRTTGTTNG